MDGSNDNGNDRRWQNMHILEKIDDVLIFQRVLYCLNHSYFSLKNQLPYKVCMIFSHWKLL